MIVLSLKQPGMSCVFQFGPWCIARTMFLIILYIFEIQNKTNPVFFFFLTLFFLTPNDFFWLLFFPLCVCVYFHPSPPKKIFDSSPFYNDLFFFSNFFKCMQNGTTKLWRPLPFFLTISIVFPDILCIWYQYNLHASCLEPLANHFFFVIPHEKIE
jgi:hypothetical protein